MKYQKLIGIVVFLATTQLVYPSGKFPALKLDLDALNRSSDDLSDLPQESEDLGKLRTMSRGYSALMQRFMKLNMQVIHDAKAFYILCRQVQTFSQKNLKNLSKNRLLYDQGHDPKQNDFNVVLLAGLRNYAKSHNFSDALIPFTIVDDTGCLSGDESGYLSSSESSDLDLDADVML